MQRKLFPQRPGDIGRGIDLRTVLRVVRQLHQIIEVSAFFVASEMQYLNEAVVGPRYRRKLLDTSKLPFVGGGVAEARLVNNLCGLERADNVFGYPNFAISALPNFANENLIRACGGEPLRSHRGSERCRCGISYIRLY